MARISLARETLEDIDRLDQDVLVLALFADERPLRGLNGLVDWRLNGRISRLLETNVLGSVTGEQSLVNAAGRLPAERLLLFGLGKKGDFDNMVFVNSCEQLVDTVLGLKPKGIALTVPGSQHSSEFLLERLAILLKELHSRYDGSVTLFVDKDENFKDFSAKFDLIQTEVANVLKHPGRP
jgi:hypothetical protein